MKQKFTESDTLISFTMTDFTTYYSVKKKLISLKKGGENKNNMKLKLRTVHKTDPPTTKILE